jgi:hypothetical protein
MGFAYSISNTKNLKDYRILQASHDAVKNFYAASENEREKSTKFLKGEHYTASEIASYAEMRRVPIVLNQFPQSRRTIMGTLLNAKMDVAFTPVGAEDQGISDTFDCLAIHESRVCNDRSQNADVALCAWLGGSGFRLITPEIEPFVKPHLRAAVLNPFCCHFDPNSTDLTSRDDAQFVDVETMMALDEIAERWHNAKIRADLTGTVDGQEITSTYTEINKSADRDSATFRNGQYKVIERFYRSIETVPCILSEDDEWIVIKDEEVARKLNPNVKVYKRKMEFLNIVQWCADITEDNVVLYNGRWHSQPRNPETHKIMFPVVECVSEAVGGEPIGFASPMRDINKLLDLMVTALIESAKHSASAYEQDPSAYINPAEASKAKRLGAYSNQTFQMKEGRLGQGMSPIEKNGVSPSVTEGIQIAKDNLDSGFSTPPPMQGASQGASVSGVLNQQRIDQASVQLVQFMDNFKAYLKRILELRLAYWGEFYTDEMVFRIEGKKEPVIINEEVQAKDEYGYDIPDQTEIKNDVSKACYTVAIVDSVNSPTMRDRNAQTIASIIPQVIQVDPVMGMKLIALMIDFSDVNQETKNEIKNHMKQAYPSAEEQAKAEEEAQAQAQMQASQQQPPMMEQQTQGMQIA